MKSWVGELINELKRRHDMSGRELAIAIGVSKNSLSDWLTGKETPSLESKRKLSDFCDRSVDELEALERGSITLQEFLSPNREVLVTPKEVRRSATNYSQQEILELISYFSEIALKKATDSVVSVMEKGEDCPSVQDNKAGLFFSPGGTMSEREVLKELVRRRIEELGVSEREFAKRCLLGLKVFHQVINGEDVPNVETKLGTIAGELINPDTQQPFVGVRELVTYCQEKSPQLCKKEEGDCCARNGAN